MSKETSIRTRLFVSHAGDPSLDMHDAETLGIRKVLRLRKGDHLACFNGDGKEYYYKIEVSTSKNLVLQLMHMKENPKDSFPPTTVVVALTKGKTKDRIVHDLPPLGISRILFYSAERSVVQVKHDQQERLQKIAVEACRQCGRSTIPRVEIHANPLWKVFEQEIRTCENTYLFWEKREKNKHTSYPTSEEEIRIIFGPEGGFSYEEIEWARKKQIAFLDMGERIFRSELAIVVGLTLVQAQRGVFSQ